MPSSRFFSRAIALGAVFLFHHGAAGDDHIVALAVELDDLEFLLLAFEVGGVAHRAHIHQRAGQEGAHGALRSTVKPPLTLPLMMPLTVSAFSNAFSR
jgi:hypothetical protein